MSQCIKLLFIVVISTDALTPSLNDDEIIFIQEMLGEGARQGGNSIEQSFLFELRNECQQKTFIKKISFHLGCEIVK